MPNHIKNRLEIIGDEEKIKEVKDFLYSEVEEDGAKIELAIDYNKILPMPKELDITSSSYGSDALKGLFGISDGKYCFSSQSELLERILKLDNDVKAIAIELGLKYYKNIKNYGYATWYQWRVANWGTKWGAYDTSYLNDNTIEWQTAWNGSIKMMQKVSEKYPAVLLNYSYADEDTGSNCQRLTIKSGEIIKQEIPLSGSKEALDLALELWLDIKESNNVWK